jgi:hypothetical protein
MNVIFDEELNKSYQNYRDECDKLKAKLDQREKMFFDEHVGFVKEFIENELKQFFSLIDKFSRVEDKNDFCGRLASSLHCVLMDTKTRLKYVQ